MLYSQASNNKGLKTQSTYGIMFVMQRLMQTFIREEELKNRVRIRVLAKVRRRGCEKVGRVKDRSHWLLGR